MITLFCHNLQINWFIY